MGNIGQSVAVFGAPVLVAYAFGGNWRPVFFVFAALALGWGVGFYLVRRRRVALALDLGRKPGHGGRRLRDGEHRAVGRGLRRAGARRLRLRRELAAGLLRLRGAGARLGGGLLPCPAAAGCPRIRSRPEARARRSASTGWGT